MQAVLAQQAGLTVTFEQSLRTTAILLCPAVQKLLIT
jgi:hypothetical protein